MLRVFVKPNGTMQIWKSAKVENTLDTTGITLTTVQTGQKPATSKSYLWKPDPLRPTTAKNRAKVNAEPITIGGEFN